MASRFPGLGQVRGLGLAMGVAALSCGTPSSRETGPVTVAEPAAGPAAPGRSPKAAPPEAVAGAEAESVPKPPPKPTLSVPAGARKLSSAALPGLLAFADAYEGQGALWVGQLPGNGGRDVVVFVPPGVEPDADVRLVVHFHGTYSENISLERPGVPKKAWVGWNRLQQVMDALTELQARDGGNVALVYPISAGKRLEPSHRGWSNKMYDRMWMTAVPDDPRYRDDFDVLVEDAIEVLETQLGVPRLRVQDKVLAEGHSAGGIALRNVAVAGTGRVAEYVFLDASFQDWADGCYAAVHEGTGDARVSMVITDGGIADPFGKRDPWCTRLEEAARQWPTLSERCEGEPERKLSGGTTCEEMSTDAQDWPAVADWCEGMKLDMREMPGAFVLRTKVPHGKQPRHFAGGLELPKDR